MRSYFDELSSQKHFIGIQQVLVERSTTATAKNMQSSRRRTVFTGTRAVKELISEILNENDEKKAVLLRKKSLEAGTLLQKRNEYNCSIVRIRAGSLVRGRELT